MEAEARIITRGTLRPQDLLEAYAQELEAVCKSEEYSDYGELLTEAYDTASAIEQLPADIELEEQAHYILEDLEDALNTHAPEGYYFGTDPNTPDEKGWFPIDIDEEY